MPALQTVLAILVAYALGCITSAYYLVQLLKHQDIRELGSGNVGGRNAGRVLGKGGFAVVAVLDALKGLLAVLFAQYLGLAGWWLAPVVLAVVAGHIWPVQLGFHGGKGIATMVGALLAYDYRIPLILLALFLIGFVLFRSASLGFVLGLLLLPLVLLALGWPAAAIGSVALLALPVLYAHRGNIRARLQRRSAGAP